MNLKEFFALIHHCQKRKNEMLISKKTSGCQFSTSIFNCKKRDKMLSNKSRSIFEKLCNFCFVILPSAILRSVIHRRYFQICNITQQQSYVFTCSFLWSVKTEKRSRKKSLCSVSAMFKISFSKCFLYYFFLVCLEFLNIFPFLVKLISSKKVIQHLIF